MTTSKRTVAILIAIIILIASIALFTRPAMTVYHRWRFNVLNDYITNGPYTIDSNGWASIDITELGPKHEYHRRRLVELGVIVKIELVFTNILEDSPARSNLLKKLLAHDCPKHLYWSSVETTAPTLTVVDVWCELENREDWILFLETENKLADTVHEQNIAPNVPVGDPVFPSTKL